MIKKSQIVKSFGPIGLYSFARMLTRNQPRILMYHRFSESPKPGCVSRRGFERQVQVLSSNYNMVSMTDLVQGLRGEKKLLPNTLAITVDDGYEDFYRIAYPVLKEYGVPATIFATTKFVDGNFWLWPDKIAWLLRQIDRIAQPVVLGGHVLAPGELTDSYRSVAWSQIVGYLLTIGDEDKHAWIDTYAKSIGHPIPEAPHEDYRAVTWDQLREMQEFGIEVGGHTHSHPSLGRVGDAQLVQELAQCKAALDLNLGPRERQFCYPNGQPQDYNERVKEAVQAAGFRSAVVAFYDKKRLSDLFEMRRYTSGEDDDFQFKKSTSGLSLISSLVSDTNNKMAWHY